MSMGNMGGMDSFVAAEAEQPKGKEELSAEYKILEEKTLNLVKEDQFQIVIDMMNRVTKEYPDCFFTLDTAFEEDYGKFKDGYKKMDDADAYYKFINRVVKPFWRKVDKAGPDVIKDTFEELRGVLG